MHHVYRNLHKSKWSVKNKATNRVTMHRNKLVMRNCIFWVSEAGRIRVLKSKQKNVHAMVRGSLCNEALPQNLNGWTEVSYNPYLKSKFYEKATGKEIQKADKVAFTSNMKVYALGLQYVE